MANKIILKKSSVAGKVPLATDLEIGEIAVNLADAKLYSKDSTGTVISVGGGGSGSGDVVGPASATDNALVRFDGTTGKLIQNGTVTQDDSGNLAGVNAISFATSPTTPPTAPGSLYWDTADGNQTLSLVMAGGTATQQIGEEQYYRIKASSAIINGQVVMFTGTVGASGALTGAPATGLTASTASYVMGIATQDIATNGWGYVTSFGLVRNIDTSAFTAGDILYLNPAVAGGLTTTIPSAPNPKVQVCACIYSSASVGSLFVRPSFGGALGQYEGDVGITSPSDGQLLIRNQTAGKWVNAALSAGTGIGVANGAGSVTISNSGVTSIAGTASQVTASASTGGVTLSLPSTINVDTSGNAATATSAGKWTTARTLSFTGDATGSGSVDGSASVATALTLANTAVTAGSYTNTSLTVDGKGRITAASSGTAPVTSVGATAPIASSGGTTPTISISQASSTTNGYLSSTDWNTFNNKTSNTGTVTSVAMTVPTGLTVSGTPITTSGTLALTLTTGYSIPTTASQTDWDSAYSQRLQWDGGSTNLVAATGRTSLGGTTAGQNFFTLTNPSAITFPRINADNTVSALDAATFRTAIGAGTGSGTVTSVTGTSPVASSGGATPAISLASAYGDTQNPYGSKTANYVLAAPNGTAGSPTFRAIVAADIPTLNQNTTGSAGSVANAVTFNNGGAGDASGTTYNGSAAKTISYNSVGAPSTTGTNASGTWGISISGTAANTSSISSAVGSSYTWTGAQYFQSNVNTASGSSVPLEAYSSNGSGAIMSFHRGGYYAVNMGLDSDNVFRIGGWSAPANVWQLDMSGNSYALASSRAPIFYDSNDTGYYCDPNSTSVLYRVGSYYLSNLAGVSTDHPYGMYFDSGLSTAYAIFRESGAWVSPYPNLRIAFHTGISLGANPSYGGINFFTDYDMATYVMSVNNASYGGGSNVYVHNSLYAQIMYDANNTGYYCDPASTSNFNSVTIAGFNFSAYNSNSLKIISATTGAIGITGYDSASTWRYQLYADGSNVGFLNAAWGGWDLQKQYGGQLLLTVSGVQYTAIHTGNISSYAATQSAGGVVLENGQTISSNYTMTSGKSGMCAGPITISTGVTVTIPTGSNWVIV